MSFTPSTKTSTDTVIIGAGPAGLSVAACLTKLGKSYIILEQSDKIANKWHNHYKRLHLHTAKEYSNLPYYNFPDQFPRYPSRQQVVRYLEDYATHFNIHPKLNTKVMHAKKSKRRWQIEAEQDSELILLEAKNLIVATGFNNEPKYPYWEGIESFRGRVLHSQSYVDGEEFKNKKVMIIGFGNSAAEIALDLWEHGAQPIMSVRSAVNILPKEILGIPTLAMGIVQQYLPTRVADTVTAVTTRAIIGDLSKYGLKTLDRGPMEEIKKNNRVPMLDIGTVDLIKKGEIIVYPAIKKFSTDSVTFVDDRESKVDVVILATGFNPDVHKFLDAKKSLNFGIPNISGKKSETKGLYFIGFNISPSGMFRGIADEAKKIAKLVK